MPASFVQSFRLIAEKLLDGLIIQTCHSVLARNCKTSKSNNVILSKMIFSPSLQKRQVHIFYMPATFVRSFRLIT